MLEVQPLLTSTSRAKLADSGRQAAKGHDLFGDAKRKMWGYFITTPGRLVERPPDGQKKSFLLLLVLLQDARSINDCYSCVAPGLPVAVDLAAEIVWQSSAKQKAEASIAAKDEAKKPKHGPASAKIVVETYWNCPAEA